MVKMVEMNGLIFQIKPQKKKNIKCKGKELMYFVRTDVP